MNLRPKWFHYWEWSILVEPRDLWIGCYWKRYPCAIVLYFSLTTVIVLRVYVQWHYRGK